VLSRIKDLDGLWIYVNKLNRKHFPSNELAPILGNGRKISPKVMFIFINPTVRNISSNPKWEGPRFPFIGTKQVWRIFHRAGLFDDELMDYINENADWSLEFTDQVLQFLQEKGFYLTNIVKWTGKDAALPDAAKINLFLPVLEKEIELVKPKYIVTFGLIPFQHLTKEKIKLFDYHSAVINQNKLSFHDITVNSVDTKVIPCYFPVGRGDPKKAVDILNMLKDLK
jgi:DNA polymerase